MYDLFAANPEYFVVNRVEPRELFIWMGVLSILIPLVISFSIIVIGLLSRNFRFWIYATTVAVLLGIFTLQLLKSSAELGPNPSLTLAFLVFVTMLFLLGNQPQVSFGISLLTPVCVIFPLLFIFNGSIQKIIKTEVSQSQIGTYSGAVWIENTPPIFLVIFDEFSLVDLLDENGEIDASRFPEIAKFADSATWYSNATTVRHATTWAVPAILTGNWPNPDALPRIVDYPQNLFTLLANHYHFDVIEPVTQLSGDGIVDVDQKRARQSRKEALRNFLEDSWVVYLHLFIPEGLADSLPSVNTQWGGFGNTENGPATVADSSIDSEQTKARKIERTKAENRLNEQLRKTLRTDRKALFNSFIDGFDRFPSNSLHFLHVLLPHRPSVYVPSGKTYADSPSILGVTEDKKTKAWLGDQAVVDKLHQRHLLQMGLVSTLWGKMIDEIKSMGIYDESLIILVADHGVSFQSNISNRRPRHNNFGEIAFVPLLIKYPDQKERSVDESNVETIDILPTLVDVLGVKVPWDFDGRSLIDDQAITRQKKFLLNAAGDVMEYSEQQYLQARQVALNRNIRTFRLNDPRATLFNYEDGLDLIGTSFATLGSKSPPCLVYPGSAENQPATNTENIFSSSRVFGELDCNKTDSEDLLVVFGSGNRVIGTTRPYIFEGRLVFDHIISDEYVNQQDEKAKIMVIDYDSGLGLPGDGP